jgi:hypothetical protein
MTRAYGFAFALALGFVAPAARAADVPITEEARAHFSAGVSFLQDPDGARYEDAYREFNAAYAASPSWKILGNLGLSAMKLERDGEAIDAYTKYLAEGGKEIERDERAQIERDLKTLQASVVYVALSIEPVGVTLTDERVPGSGATVVNRYGPLGPSARIGLRPGHHRLTVELTGYEKSAWELDAVPKQEQTHGFALQALAQAPVAPVAAPPPPVQEAPPPAEESSGSGLRTGAYAAFGVGVVGLGLGTVFGLQANGKYSDANAMCPDFPCQLTQAQADKRQGLADDGDKAKTISLVGFIVGGVGVATGVTLFVLSSGKNEHAAVTVSPVLGFGSAALRGSF